MKSPSEFGKAYETRDAAATSPPSPDGYYAAGTAVQLTAIPGAGQALRYWLGDLRGNGLTGTVTMDQQRLVTSYFNTPVALRVLNGASFISNPLFDLTGAAVTPYELVSVFGNNIGPATGTFGQIDSGGKVTTSVAGIQVMFDSTPAPITYAGPNQINVVVPGNVTPWNVNTTTTVRVLKNGTPVASLAVSADTSAPAMFTLDSSGVGPIAALNQDGSVNTASNPAPHGSAMVLYATGGGAWTSPVPDGLVIGSNLVAPAAPVFVRVGKLPAKILYVGTSPGLVNGALQVNVQLPDELIGGAAVPIQLIAGSLASPPGTTIAVQ